MIPFQIFFWIWPSLDFVKQLSTVLLVWLMMLNIIFTIVAKLVIMNLFEQITLTMSVVIVCFQRSIKTTFNKQPFFVRVLV